MIEMLDVHHANNKYSYYYKNLNTGRTIKKEGRGRRADKYNVYQELKERYNELEEDDDDYEDDNKEDDNDDNGIDIKFDIEIDLSDLFN